MFGAESSMAVPSGSQIWQRIIRRLAQGAGDCRRYGASTIFGHETVEATRFENAGGQAINRENSGMNPAANTANKTERGLVAPAVACHGRERWQFTRQDRLGVVVLAFSLVLRKLAW
jgi:hypothetical protein